MADFITKKERGRRLGVLITLIILDTAAIALGIYGMKGADDIDHGEDVPENIQMLKKAVEDLRVRKGEHERKLREFSERWGWVGQSVTTAEDLPTGWLQHEQAKVYLDYWLDVLEKEYALQPGKYTRWSNGANETNGLTVTRLFDELKERIDYYRNEIAKREQEINSNTSGFKKQEADTLTKMRSDDAEVARDIEGDSGLIKELDSLLVSYGRQKQEHEQELRDEEQRWRAKEEELTGLKKKNIRAQQVLESKKVELTERINWIVHYREEARERKDPDGVVLEVDNRMKVAWIDAARKDRLFMGTKFRVYTLEKGGVKVDKGEVEVIEVGVDRSKVSILSQFGDEPIKPDDRIYNEYFERGKPRYIAFAGRFVGKLSNQDAARLVTDFGDYYQKKVDQKTNYLVVGEGYEEHPNFKFAMEWGVKILIERYLYDYLGVPEE